MKGNPNEYPSDFGYYSGIQCRKIFSPVFRQHNISRLQEIGDNLHK